MLGTGDTRISKHRPCSWTPKAYSLALPRMRDGSKTSGVSLESRSTISFFKNFSIIEAHKKRKILWFSESLILSTLPDL